MFKFLVDLVVFGWSPISDVDGPNGPSAVNSSSTGTGPNRQGLSTMPSPKTVTQEEKKTSQHGQTLKQRKRNSTIVWHFSLFSLSLSLSLSLWVLRTWTSNGSIPLFPTNPAGKSRPAVPKHSKHPLFPTGWGQSSYPPLQGTSVYFKAIQICVSRSANLGEQRSKPGSPVSEKMGLESLLLLLFSASARPMFLRLLSPRGLESPSEQSSTSGSTVQPVVGRTTEPTPSPPKTRPVVRTEVQWW